MLCIEVCVKSVPFVIDSNLSRSLFSRNGLCSSVALTSTSVLLLQNFPRNLNKSILSTCLIISVNYGIEVSIYKGVFGTKKEGRRYLEMSSFVKPL